MFDLDQLRAATQVVYSAMAPTPQFAWPLLRKRTGCDVWVKHESHTPTGAFKVRGGLVYLDALRRSGRPVSGLISATRGNHGQSLAFAGQRHDIPVTIVVPTINSRDQNDNIRAHGAELVEAGDDFDAARATAVQMAEDRRLDMVPPYHPLLVRGVGTYAFELFNAVADLDAVYVAIGMGSGISGLITVRDLLGLKTEIVGVVSSRAPAFALSFQAGHVVTTETADTFADGIATRQPLPEALEVVRRGAARIVQVTDGEIADAIRAYYHDAHTVAEGAGAAPLAGLLHERERMRGKRVGVILSGSNLDAPQLSAILNGATPTLGLAA